MHDINLFINDKFNNKYLYKGDNKMIKIIGESKKITESIELEPLVPPHSYAWQGVNDFSDGTTPLWAESEYATLLVGGAEDKSGYSVISIYFGEDYENPSWGFKSYEDKDSAIKDAKVLIKMLDSEIDKNQLIRFGFTMVC